MTTPQSFLPAPRQRELIREDQFKPWWRQAEERWYGKFAPQNVRHIHDKLWRERVWSIQAAHDRKGIWLPVSWLFYTAMYAFSVGAVVLSVLAIGVPMIALGAGVVIFMRFFKKAAEDA